MAEPASKDSSSGQYFEPSPSSRSKPKEIRLDLPDLSLTLATDRGVFSPDRIDTGTKHLLLDGPVPSSEGTLVDLGCGYGPIACALARRSPAATVWAIDVNERALELCRANAERLGLANVRVVPADEVAAAVVVDELWSNPPIRIGKAQLHHLLGTWLDRLAPTGRAVLVVQKHLGADSLHRWMESAGWSVDRRSSRAGYRVFEVRPG
jgi:16S rRNA (guanine1207-N2)-methyltransferase